MVGHPGKVLPIPLCALSTVECPSTHFGTRVWPRAAHWLPLLNCSCSWVRNDPKEDANWSTVVIPLVFSGNTIPVPLLSTLPWNFWTFSINYFWHAFGLITHWVWKSSTSQTHCTLALMWETSLYALHMSRELDWRLILIPLRMISLFHMTMNAIGKSNWIKYSTKTWLGYSLRCLCT